jgi:hypothetical protein
MLMLNGVNGLIAVLVFGLDVWAIINVLQSAASPGNKALWIVLIAVLPVVGLILWLLMGPRRGPAVA